MSQAEAMFPTRAARRQKTAEAGITNSVCIQWSSALFQAQGSAVGQIVHLEHRCARP